MTAGPIAEESELLFFNAVFHLTSSTVDLVVEPLRAPDQVGDHKARVGSLGGVLGFGNNTSFLIPTAGPILEAFKEADFFAAFAMFTFGALPQLGTQSLEPLILGDADDVIDLVSLTPTQHFPATEPAIGRRIILTSGQRSLSALTNLAKIAHAC